jgi:hypothetical protein
LEKRRRHGGMHRDKKSGPICIGDRNEVNKGVTTAEKIEGF